MKDEIVKDLLLSAGVVNLKEAGYSSVKKTNILKDKIYSAFFKEMLVSEKGSINSTPQVDRLIDDLVSEINKNASNA